ncbi:hypothetical protein WG899_09305 [Paucibacter sp. AS339]|uniref:hypothetical protein n=1 Tax=Paucibacter hankyongi TaxID=3133434 RepID=UPI0030AB4691
MQSLCVCFSALMLAACGGGGGSGADSTPTATAPTTVPSTVPSTVPGTTPADGAASAARLSLPAYAATRKVPAGSPAPDSERRLLQNASLALAIAQLQAGAPAGTWLGNAQVSPALSASLEQLLRAAAAGATLAQIPSLLPDLAQARQVAASNWVQRSLWAAQGQSFNVQFLAASDLSSGAMGLPQWRGAETDFTSSAAKEFQLAKQAQLPPQSADTIVPVAQTRLVVIDSLRTRFVWPDVELAKGRFKNERGEVGHGDFLRVRQGVQRYQVPEFTADLLQQDDFLLIYLRPMAGSLQAFLAGSPQPALQQVLNAADAKTLSPGELVLPLTRMGLAADYAAPLVRGGLSLAMDEVKADLRGLDGGGSYARFQSPTALLQISESGLDLQSAHVLSLIASDKNVFGPNYASGSQWLDRPGFNFGGSCDLPLSSSSGFLLVLDRQRMVLSLSVLADVAATPCAF